MRSFDMSILRRFSCCSMIPVRWDCCDVKKKRPHPQPLYLRERRVNPAPTPAESGVRGEGVGRIAQRMYYLIPFPSPERTVCPLKDVDLHIPVMEVPTIRSCDARSDVKESFTRKS